MRVQLGEVEHVADEPAEPLRLGGDDLERRLGQLGIGDDAFAQGGDVAADRGQRRAQLVRDGHEEVALALLRLRETGRHLAKALREMTDLVVRRHVGHLDVVVPRGDLVHRLGEREHRLGEPAGEVEREAADDDERGQEREREAPEQRHPGLAQLRLRLRHDQVRERDAALSPPEPHRVRDRHEGAVLTGRLELERDDPVAAEVDADLGGREPGQAGVLPGARIGRRADDLEEAVAGRRLELLGGERRRGLVLVEGADGRLRVQLREAARLLAQLLPRHVAV